MNKTDLIKNVSAQIEGATQKDVAVIVDTVLETIVNTVASGEKVSLAGFGNFEVVERAARKGRNPKTGEPLEIAASKSAKHVDEKSGIVQLGENKGSTWHKDAEDQLVFKISKSVKTLA